MRIDTNKNLSLVVNSAGPGFKPSIPLAKADFELGSAQFDIPIMNYRDDASD